MSDDRATEEGDMRVRDVLTLRDHFAGLALQGYVASWPGSATVEHIPTVAMKCYHFADAMLKARLA